MNRKLYKIEREIAVTKRTIWALEHDLGPTDITKSVAALGAAEKRLARLQKQATRWWIRGFGFKSNLTNKEN